MDLNELPKGYKMMELFRWEDTDTPKPYWLRLFPDAGRETLNDKITATYRTAELEAMLDLMGGDPYDGTPWRRYVLSREEFEMLAGIKGNSDGTD